MRAGQLRHNIVIQQATATNTGGVTTNVWTEYDTVRAEVVPISGTELWAAKQVQDEDVVMFKARYLSGVTQKMRVLHGYKAYDIKSVIDAKGRGREMFIRTTLAPQEYANFAYGTITFATGENQGDIIVSWPTGFYSSSNVRVRETGYVPWITKTETDTDPRVLSHSFTITNAKASTDYDVQVWGENEATWSPGWSDTAQFSTDEEFQVVQE